MREAQDARCCDRGSNFEPIVALTQQSRCNACKSRTLCCRAAPERTRFAHALLACSAVRDTPRLQISGKSPTFNMQRLQRIHVVMILLIQRAGTRPTPTGRRCCQSMATAPPWPPLSWPPSRCSWTASSQHSRRVRCARAHVCVCVEAESGPVSVRVLVAQVLTAKRCTAVGPGTSALRSFWLRAS
jgi:hypothetical protein